MTLCSLAGFGFGVYRMLRTTLVLCLLAPAYISESAALSQAAAGTSRQDVVDILQSMELLGLWISLLSLGLSGLAAWMASNASAASAKTLHHVGIALELIQDHIMALDVPLKDNVIPPVVFTLVRDKHDNVVGVSPTLRGGPIAPVTVTVPQGVTFGPGPDPAGPAEKAN